MGVNMATGVTGTVENYTAAYQSDVTAANNTAENTAAETTKGETTENKADDAVVYEKTEQTTQKPTYTVNKMSAEDRKALVDKLKADQESRQQSLVDLVQGMMSKQTNVYGQANDVWKFLASGNYTVDAETKAKAQADISEDGYYGVKKTSERLFDFASALAGDDVDKMKEMQAAMKKGYKQAEKTWGGELPDLCKKTIEAADKLFADYYASKKETVTEEKADTEITE